MNLLAQDIYWMANEWHKMAGLTSRESVLPQPPRKECEEKLESAIGEWLAKGIEAVSTSPSDWSNAFKPVSHIIGTSLDSISYLPDVEEIAEVLSTERDPFYKHTPPDDILLLGPCYEGGVSRALEMIVEDVCEKRLDETHSVGALVDALVVVQGVKPYNMSSVLPSVWNKLNSPKNKLVLQVMEKIEPWAIKHAFALACYPVCCSANGPKVQGVITDLWNAAKADAPRILKSDLVACKKALRGINIPQGPV